MVGFASGYILHFLSKLGFTLFGLDVTPAPKDRPAKGHSAASYRVAREKKKKRDQEQLDRELSNAAKTSMQMLDPVLRQALQRPSAGRFAVPPKSPGVSRRPDGLLGTTILEEVEDSDEGYGF